MMRNIVVTGNPVYGFYYYGPFDSVESASEWARTTLSSPDWWVAGLTVIGQ
jgi:hypothetical protein